jgi:glycosyltransferase involved in cell wall biosynthesis
MAADPNETAMRAAPPLTVAWISDYPVEWMPDLPAELRGLARQHPATWAMVLLDEFKRRPKVKLHVLVLRSKVRGDVTFEREGVTFHVLRAPGPGRLLSLFWWDTLLIRRRLRAIRPDVIHAWGTERGASLIASRLGRPYVATMQGLLTWYVGIVKDAPRFIRVMARLEPMALRRARVVTVESQFAVRYLRERYARPHVLQVEHAPNPLFRDIARRPETAPPRLLCVGSLGFGKGTDLVLEAVQRLAPEFDFRLTLVSGPNPAYLAELKQRFPASVWERVDLKLGLTPAQVADELGRATIFVLPTRVDNSPNSVKEAAVVGVPVVASDIGGIPDYIRPGENGFLFPTGDANALTSALRDALNHPQFRRGEVNAATWRQMREYLSPAHMAEGFLNAYRTSLAAWGKADGSHPPA